ncbi:twin-arginine translocase TatA/TatE family subunit [Selenomonas sp. TAMA-11512]|uniref:twin-arginine translocase TatA/TatE family subunit n=1 Tax=Selenomonas sp. TAMA-11512 TaxID=3095337 RepID=UPI00309167A8|nr:twin-arginine translocase TatA/TatE family subunit [Selenomonas sp. TAMA-11512]
MFGLGVPELLIILVIGLIFFGPGKLPEIGKALGKSIKEFKAAGKEEKEMKNVTAMKTDDAIDAPAKRDEK